MMSKFLNKIVAICLVAIISVSNCIIVSAETVYTKGYITINNVGDNEHISYEAIDVNGELFVSSDDIAKIINMEATNCEDSVFYSNYYANRSIDVCFDGSIWTQGLTYKATVHNIEEIYYFPLEKLLYLANAQWCVENNILYIQLTDNTILDFIDAYCMEIFDNNITQTELLMNGESELSNAAKSSFAAIFSDFDVRVFVPIWGAITLTVEDYQNAMLQLAKDELVFVDEYGQNNLDNLLDESSFSEIKSIRIWNDAQSVADLPENMLSATDYVNQTYLWIKDAKNGTKLFSEYNNLADFTPAEISAISKELQGVSDVLTIANAIVNVNEIATRSKSWNEDFLAQIELLTDFDETGYNKSMVNYIKKASISLLEEHADTFSATTDACVEETLKVLGGKLVDLTPAGTLTSIITTGLSVAKLLDGDFATSFDALELSNMVEWLIRIEHVAFTEMSRDIVAMRTSSLNGGSTLEELTELRNTTMLALRTNLRNKVFIYYLNTVRNDDTSWSNSDEAKEIEQDILWNYAKITELSESEPFDKLLILDSFENMYSNEYGCKRDKIRANVLSETNIVLSPEHFDENTAYMEFLNTKGYTEYMSDWYYNEPREYAILDIDADNCAELIISGNDGLGFCNFIVFSYNTERGEIIPLTFIDRTGGYEGNGYVNQFYQDLFLSKYQNALVFESLNNGTAFEYLEYWMIEESEIIGQSTIYYDPYYGTYHYGELIGNSEKELTQDDYIQRKSELTLVEFLPIPTSSSDIGTELVSDAWNQNGSRIPKINIDSPAIKQLNETIYSNLEAEGFFEGFDYGVLAVDYRWYQNDDIVSIIVEQLYDGGFNPTSVYNVSVDGKTELSPGALINNVLSLDWDTYEEQVRAAIASTFCDVFCGVDASYKTTLEPYMMQMFEDAISDATVESALPYLNENGELCIIVEFASIAGPSTIYYDINLETYETSPYVESMMDALGGNTVSNSAMEEVLEQYLIACFYADGDAFAELLIPGLLEYMMVTENWTRAELVDDLTDLLTDWMGYDEMEGYDALWPYNFIPPDQLEISYSIERETALTSAEFNDMRNQYEQILDITISELKILEVSFRAIDKTNSSISLNAVSEVCLIITGKGCYIMPG